MSLAIKSFIVSWLYHLILVNPNGVTPSLYYDNSEKLALFSES